MKLAVNRDDWSRTQRLPAPRIGGSGSEADSETLQENAAVLLFKCCFPMPMFVPSLSWYNDGVFIAKVASQQRDAFSYLADANQQVFRHAPCENRHF